MLSFSLKLLKFYSLRIPDLSSFFEPRILRVFYISKLFPSKLQKFHNLHILRLPKAFESSNPSIYSPSILWISKPQSFGFTETSKPPEKIFESSNFLPCRIHLARVRRRYSTCFCRFRKFRFHCNFRILRDV